MSLIPEPQDLEKDECSTTFLGLREEIMRLHEKYGHQAKDVLRDVLALVQKYEVHITGLENKTEKQILEKYKNIDEATITRAQNIVRAFLKRKRFTALASQFLSSPLARELGKRNDIWKEILSSERIYFQNLVFLYETYYKPLKIKALASDHKILTEKQINKIYQNIEDIKNTAKTMWKRLEEAGKNWPEQSPKVGAIFLAMIPEIKSFYIPYCKQIGESLKNLAKLRKKSHAFAEFLDKTANDALANNGENALPLSTLLMLPISRLTQYETYLRDLLVLTPGEHVDYPTLAKAAREIANIAHECVPSKTDAQKIQRLFNVTQSLRGPNAPNLLAKDIRAFVREGPTMTVTDKKVKRSYIFLFTDSLVVTDVNEGTEDRTFDQLITLAGSEVRDVPDTPQIQNMFAIIRENRRTVLCCSTYEEKKSWMNDISMFTNTNNASARRSLTRDTPTRVGSGLDVMNVTRVNVQNERYASSDSSSQTSGFSPGSNTVLSPRTKKSKLIGLIQSQGFLLSLERQHSNKALEDFVDVIPAKVKLIKLSHKECIVKFSGPQEGESESEKGTPFASARAISTFPYLKKKNQRECDPIADHFGLAAFHNRILGVIADGCGHGAKAHQASTRAVETAITNFTDTKTYLADLRDVALELLKSLSNVHDMLIQGKKVVWEAGTTTLLVGMLVEVEPNVQLNHANWCFVCANVGDCKAFHWSKSNGQISEITLGSRGNVSDRADPGGRLGPYIYQGSPDLRNLQLYYWPCAEDDIIILLTNGVYDNFDPELNGLSPRDLHATVINYQNRSPMRPDQLPSRWDQLDPIKADLLKSFYRNVTMEKLLSEIDPQPRNIAKMLVAHAYKTTRNAREFVEANSEKPVPQDYQLYPGVMDHATCLVFQVGQVQSL